MRQIILGGRSVIQDGFTVVERLVVMVILGVLAVVAVFAVVGITHSVESQACDIEVGTINTAIQAFDAHSAHDTFPPGPSAARLIAQLGAAHLISSGTGRASNLSPSYNPATGVYAANCP